MVSKDSVNHNLTKKLGFLFYKKKIHDLQIHEP